MGLFGKLFDKKNCAICGGEIGLMGNKKLEDGNLCKKCNAKLSPFFDERRHSTVAEIEEHLNYREANQEALKNFHASRTMGGYKKLYVDEAAGTFVVSNSRNWRDENADVIPMSEIADARMDVSDYKTEIKRQVKKSDGTTESVSYNPPRYTYHYNLYLDIEMNESFRWFRKIRIDLNDSTIEVTPQPAGNGIFSALTGSGSFDPRSNPDYSRAERLGEEMIQVLMGRRNAPAAPAAAEVYDASAPKMITCDYCGSRFAADGSGKCPYCGANVG